MLTTYCSRLPFRAAGAHPLDVSQRSERYRRRRSPEPREIEDPVRPGPLVANRPSADEASADEARLRLREDGIVPIEPDDRIRVMLAPGEIVAAVRRSVSLERRKGARESPGLIGDLYVTTRRLVHLGRDRVEYSLCEIRDAVEAEGALRLIVGDQRGIEIRVSDPRLLRVEIAAVREAARLSAADVGPAPVASERDDASRHVPR